MTLQRWTTKTKRQDKIIFEDFCAKSARFCWLTRHLSFLSALMVFLGFHPPSLASKPSPSPDIKGLGSDWTLLRRLAHFSLEETWRKGVSHSNFCTVNVCSVLMCITNLVFASRTNQVELRRVGISSHYLLLLLLLLLLLRCASCLLV